MDRLWYPLRGRGIQWGGPLPGAHGIQGNKEANTTSARVGGGEHGSTPQRLHFQGTDSLLRQELHL